MTAERAIVWVERLIWTFVYGGLFTLVIGLATRGQDNLLGWSLIVIGALIAAIGAGLIYVRSRLDQNG